MSGCGHPHPGNGGAARRVCSNMSDNFPVTIRPIEPGDKDGLASFFSQLSDESRRRRFLGPKPKLSQRDLKFLTEVDQCRHVALVAVDADDAIVGVGRYATWHDSPDRAEMAFVVLDGWQGRGLGTRLGEHLVSRARASGMTALTGSTFATNTPAKALLKRLGFLPKGISAGIAEYELAFGAAA